MRAKRGPIINSATSGCPSRRRFAARPAAADAVAHPACYATELQGQFSVLPGGAGFCGFACQPERLEALAVVIERLLRCLVIAHRLLGVGAARGVAGLPFFGGEDFGRTGFIIFCHAQPTRKAGKSSPVGSRGGT